MNRRRLCSSCRKERRNKCASCGRTIQATKPVWKVYKEDGTQIGKNEYPYRKWSRWEDAGVNAIESETGADWMFDGSEDRLKGKPHKEVYLDGLPKHLHGETLVVKQYDKTVSDFFEDRGGYLTVYNDEM